MRSLGILQVSNCWKKSPAKTMLGAISFQLKYLKKRSDTLFRKSFVLERSILSKPLIFFCFINMSVVVIFATLTDKLSEDKAL